MSRFVYKSVFLFLILFSCVAHSLTIENVDAFKQGDNLAIRDVETGLVWLDFGVNNGESINSVVTNLNGTYSGWRLPSEAEVIDFWVKLTASDLSGIFDLWGANKTPSDHLPYLAWGYFVDEDGYLGAAYIMEELDVSRKTSAISLANPNIVAGLEKKIVDVKYDGSDYYLFNLDGAAEISTLLVKKTVVSEPPLLFLLLMSALILSRSRWLFSPSLAG
ncbi:hypothetical protein [Cellvibrio sp. OA-2007]|uniref:hypothetical protein n=1 Tax=Cellvibrio sp. OA-2007 TaxID=529823 RepID=UPI0007856918|nr:hypothetical protein [Cellvibrio sp. OA-2007]